VPAEWLGDAYEALGAQIAAGGTRGHRRAGERVVRRWLADWFRQCRPGMTLRDGLCSGSCARSLLAYFDRMSLEPCGKCQSPGCEVCFPDEDQVVTQEAPAVAPRVESTGDELERVVTCKSPGQVTSLAGLLAAGGVDTHTWHVDKHVVNRWEVANAAGEVTPLWQVKAWLSRRLLSRIERAPFFAVPSSEPGDSRAVRTALILPDTQTGFTWGPGHQTLIPYHDRRALEVARLMAAALDPDEVIWLGDNQDFEELSLKFTRDPLAAQTTQPGIDEQAWWYSRFKVSAPRASHRVFDGNHEHRMEKALQERAPWAVHLKAPGSDRAVMSVPYLLGLDDMGIEWLGEYGSEWWLWDKVRISHGDTVASGGGRTVSKVAAASSFSQVFGHIHHLEMACKTIWGPNGAETIGVMSPGCLCRVDGAVPGVKARPDWQQGVGVLELDEETGNVTMHPVQIVNGRAVYAGQVYVATDRTDQIAGELGYPQMRASASG